MLARNFLPRHIQRRDDFATCRCFPIPASNRTRNAMIKSSRIAKSIIAASLLCLAAISANAQGLLNNQYVAMYGATTATTVPVDTWTIINFNSKEADTANAVTTGTGWYFAAPDAAYLSVQTSVQWNGITTGGTGYYDAIAIFKNGTFFKVLQTVYQWSAMGISINSTVGGSTLVAVQPGDLIDVRIYHHSGASGTTFNNVERSWISISRVK